MQPKMSLEVIITVKSRENSLAKIKTVKRIKLNLEKIEMEN